MAKVLKCNITLLGLFPLPDIFVNKDNFSDNVIKQKVYEGKLNELYCEQSEHPNPITFKYFEGPRRLPKDREVNKFWTSLLGSNVWAPLFYKSSDNLKVEIDSFEDENVKNFFNKLSMSKKQIRCFIRIFPIGGYSIHITFDFTISNNSECFTTEDLQTIVEDLFDSIKFKIKTKSDVIISDITISEIFEKLGSKIREKFLLNPNQMHLGMIKHAIISIDEYKGVWIKKNIVDLAEGDIMKLGIIPEDLMLIPGDNNVIATDVYYSGEMCTFLVPTTESNKRKYLKEIIDVAEFVHLRKLIVEEYTKEISDKNIEIAGKIDDLSFLNHVRNYKARRNLTWINERFIANLQRLIELDKRIKSPKLRENIVLRMLESIKYGYSLNELKKELERAQTYTEKYNKKFSKRLEVIIEAIKVAIKFIP